jgi:hypothetical protein
MKKALLFCQLTLIAVVLTGCATPGGGPILPTRTVQPSPGKFAVINIPTLNEEITAELGQPMIARSNSLTTAAISLKQPVSVPTQNNGINFYLYVPSGTMKKSGEDSQGEFFSSAGVNTTFNILGSSNTTKHLGGLYIPRDQPRTPTIYWMSRTPNVALTTPAPAAVWEKVPDIVETSPENFKRELIYTGISKNVISIVYREYINDMARPAFAQDLKYDLGEGKVIGFKGSRFEVVKATNLGITYRVLKHLD